MTFKIIRILNLVQFVLHGRDKNGIFFLSEESCCEWTQRINSKSLVNFLSHM